MKLFLCLLFLGAALGHVRAVQEGDWKLVWSDDFQYTGLPDPAKWDYEEGFIRNNEVQYYTRNRLENARVENGLLIIQGCKESYTSPDGKQHANYTSASLITKGRASWTCGRLEMSARMPQGRGMWPAFWTLGNNIDSVGWPRCGEIDILEYLGRTPGMIYGTIHRLSNGKEKGSQGITNTSSPGDFHTYAVEWSPERVDWYFDQTKYHSFDVASAGSGDENPCTKAQYIILNLALGGSWGKAVDDSALPQQFQIKYVRVYQKTQNVAPK